SPAAWLLVVGLGAVVGLVDAGQAYMLLPVAGRRLPLARILLVNVSYWITFAALVPAVFFLAYRFRLDQHPSGLQFLFHSFAAVLFVFAHFGLAALIVITSPQMGQTVWDRFFNLLRNYSAGNFLQYWAIVGFFYTIHYYHEVREGEVRAAQLQATL